MFTVFPGPPPFDPARFVRAGGNEKTSLFPCADCWSWGLEPPAEWLAPARREMARQLAGEYGGGSANHVASRNALALLSAAVEQRYSAAEIGNLRRVTARIWGAKCHMRLDRSRGGDETQAPGYRNYWGGAACQALQALLALGWTEELEVVRRWLQADLALMKLCSLAGKVYTAGKRTEKPFAHPSSAAAFGTLTAGRIAGKAVYAKLNKSRTIGNRYATMARGLVQTGLWTPKPADYEHLPLLSAAAGTYHVARGSGWLRVWCEDFLVASGGDWTHFGVEAAGGEVRWWSELDGGKTPRTKPPWGAAFPGRATEQWAGGTEGWRRAA